MQKILLRIDRVSTWFGQTSSWLIVALTFLMTWEIFSRRFFDAPHAWVFDAQLQLYGTLFMLAGAYTLSKSGHVRGDVLYGFFSPRVQASIDLTLYIAFFIPGIVALTYAGTIYAADAWKIKEMSSVMVDGPPVYTFKTIIPIAGALMVVQGFAEIARCVICLRTGAWPSRVEDVQEVDVDKLKKMVNVKDEDIQALDKFVIEQEKREGAEAVKIRIRKELWFGFTLMALILIPTLFFLPAPWNMSGGQLGLFMLCLVVVAIMLGFPTAFTLMGMGVLFAFLAYRFQAPAPEAFRQTLMLMVQRAYAVMTNDVLISIPLFVFMGYLVERAALIEKLFKSLHLAIGRLPGSLAVATLVTCAVFATATGIIGAVVTLMGLLALPAMLRARYDIKLSAGVITAGGTLGILIPPSVLLILYGATASVSVVQLYAGAFFPGLMLASLYVGYVDHPGLVEPQPRAQALGGGGPRRPAGVGREPPGRPQPARHPGHARGPSRQPPGGLVKEAPWPDWALAPPGHHGPHPHPLPLRRLHDRDGRGHRRDGGGRRRGRALRGGKGRSRRAAVRRARGPSRIRAGEARRRGARTRRQ